MSQILPAQLEIIPCDGKYWGFSYLLLKEPDDDDICPDFLVDKNPNSWNSRNYGMDSSLCPDKYLLLILLMRPPVSLKILTLTSDKSEWF